MIHFFFLFHNNEFSYHQSLFYIFLLHNQNQKELIEFFQEKFLPVHQNFFLHVFWFFQSFQKFQHLLIELIFLEVYLDYNNS